MLYDPKWEKTETKADPLTLGAFIAWLGTQNPTRKYEFMDCQGRCLVGLYYLSVYGADCFDTGMRPLLGDVFGPRGTDRRERLYTEIACARPWTFGAALERARALAS